MATFMEELRRCFRFVGYGEAGERLTITGTDGTVIRMLPVFLLDKAFNFRVEDKAAYAALPSAGTMVYLQGVLRRRRSSVEGLSGQLDQLIYQGKPGWKVPSDSDVLAGLRFEGSGVVSRITSGVYQGREFCSVQVASWGCTVVFKHFASGVFERIVEESQSQFISRLDAKVVNAGDFVTDELIPEVLQYRVFDEKLKTPEKEKPAA
jgi:hypothetical protein